MKRGAVIINICISVGEHGECVGVWVEVLWSLVGMIKGVTFWITQTSYFYSCDFTECLTFIHKCLINCRTERGIVMIKICTCVGEHGECAGVWVKVLWSLVGMIEGVTFWITQT